MNNSTIRSKAKEYTKTSKYKYLLVLIFITLINILPALINYRAGAIISIVLCTIEQGCIHASYKLYKGKEDTIQTFDDGLYGLINIKSLFITYITNFIIVSMLTFVLSLILTVFIYIMFSIFGISFELESIMLNNSGVLIMIIGILCIIILGIPIVIYSIFSSATFYLLEDGKGQGIQLITDSFKLVSKHFGQLFRLKLSYIGWGLIAPIICFIVYALTYRLYPINILPIIVLYVIINCIFYTRRYQMAMLIFYENVLKNDNNKVLDNENNEDDNIISSNNFDELSYSVEDEFLEENSLEEDVKEMNEKHEFVEDLSKKTIVKGLLIYLPIYFFITNFVVTFFLGIAIYLYHITNLSLLNSYLNMFIGVINLFVAIIMFKQVFQNVWKGFKQNILPHLFGFIIKNYCITLCLITIASLIVSLFVGGADSVNQANIESFFSDFPIPMFISSVICAPIVEEFVFRFIIFRTIRQKSFILAHLVSAFLFGFIHVSAQVFAGNFQEMIQIIPYFAMGFVLSYSYEKYRTLAAPITVHCVNNLMAMLLLMFN